MARKKSNFGGPFLPVPRWVLEYTGRDHAANTVLLFFLQYMDNDTQELTTSYQHIADLMGCNKRTVIRAIHRLSEVGIIQKSERTKNGRQLTNSYYITFNNPACAGGVTLNNPACAGGVTPESLLGVTQESLGGDTGVTPGGDTGVTQSRLKNKTKKIKKGDFEKNGVFVDGRLLSE